MQSDLGLRCLLAESFRTQEDPTIKMKYCVYILKQSTLVISKSKGLSEILRYIRFAELRKNKSNDHII